MWRCVHITPEPQGVGPQGDGPQGDGPQGDGPQGDGRPAGAAFRPALQSKASNYSDQTAYSLPLGSLK